MRWMIGGLLASLYVWMIAVQALWVWNAVIKKKKVGHILEAVFLGIPSGVFSTLILPLPFLKPIWWITLFFHFAGLVYLTWLVRLLWRRVFGNEQNIEN